MELYANEGHRLRCFSLCELAHPRISWLMLWTVSSRSRYGGRPRDLLGKAVPWLATAAALGPTATSSKLDATDVAVFAQMC